MKKTFVHAKAVIDDGASIGEGTRVWAFAHILAGATLGQDCNVCDHTFIEGGVKVGNRVTIKCGVSLWDSLVIEDDVFIGPGVVFTNDNRPRSRKYPAKFPTTLLRVGASIGANATILPGLTIGRWSMIGAGAVVTHDVPDYALVYGTPARLKGWVCRCGQKLAQVADGEFSCTCGRSYQGSSEVGMKEARVSV